MLQPNVGVLFICLFVCKQTSKIVIVNMLLSVVEAMGYWKARFLFNMHLVVVVIFLIMMSESLSGNS